MGEAYYSWKNLVRRFWIIQTGFFLLKGTSVTSYKRVIQFWITEIN